MQTDAFDLAIGGVLVQGVHPIAIENRKLNEAKQRYLAYEKEMLVVVHCLVIWRLYLLGMKFLVQTDNVANTYFKMQKKLYPKQARYQEFFVEYDFEWAYKPGKNNYVVNALSRKNVSECSYAY